MDAKEEIKQKLSIEEVVGDYLELKRAGRNWKGISPFTSERTPSFMVSPEKQIWHDFSSNKGGDMFSFIMEVDGVDFREALEILARKAGVDLSQYNKSGNGETAKLKKRLLEANSLAAQFYHLCLSKQPTALSYIKEKRQFTTETIRTWQLGYSPDDGTALLNFLTKRGFTTTELQKSGLITKRHSGWGDMFRGRIMVPLADGQGNIVGFTARILKDNPQAPKYFNTPQTLIYDKGRQVFGLHHAKDQIRKKDYSVVVEGNFDVIASHQAGIQNVVATAGTAMTPDHLRSLSRLSLHVRLAFDQDAAGMKATERAIPIAQQVGVELGIVQLPEGAKDPDELISRDPAGWEKAVESAADAITWTLSQYEQTYDKNTAAGKRDLSGKALAVIGGLQDPVEKEHHLQELAKTLGISEQSLMTKLAQTTKKLVAKKATQIAPAEPDKTAYEDDFLALNCAYPEVRESLSQKIMVLHSPRRQALYQALVGFALPERLNEEKARELHIDEDYVKILLFTAEEKYASFSPADIMAETMALARRIYKESKKDKKNELTQAIRAAEGREAETETAQLLKEYQQLLEEE